MFQRCKYLLGKWNINRSKTFNRIQIYYCDGTSVAIDSSGFIHVDIDGPNKGNNKWGTDIFRFLISNNTVQPARDSNFTWYLTDLTSHGQSASGWVIDYDNIDYLKIKNGKCPNGSTPTEANQDVNKKFNKKGGDFITALLGILCSYELLHHAAHSAHTSHS